MVRQKYGNYIHKGYEIKRTFNLFGGNTFDVKWYCVSRNWNYNSLRADTLYGIVKLINNEVNHFNNL